MRYGLWLSVSNWQAMDFVFWNGGVYVEGGVGASGRSVSSPGAVSCCSIVDWQCVTHARVDLWVDGSSPVEAILGRTKASPGNDFECLARKNGKPL